MVNRRRGNNRGGRTGNKTNLDDLDGALSGMIKPRTGVKLAVDPSEERRFTMHASIQESTRAGSIFAGSLKENDPVDATAFGATHTSDFEKHQVNYSATKYIKP